MDDEKIVELYLLRNEAAIRETADKYGRRLRALSYSIVADAQTAQECENDTYLQAWNAIPPHEPKTYFYAFLARIIRHISLNRCRVEKAELGRMINRFLGTLRPDMRNVFLRRYWFLDSVSAISERYGYSESKVKSMLLRSRNRLREQLIKEGYDL